MVIYPDRIKKILIDLKRHVRHDDGSSQGISAAFECGANVRFAITVEKETTTLHCVTYSSNGCGYMVAAAEAVATAMQGRKLTELDGSIGIEQQVRNNIGKIDSARFHCVDVSIEAFRRALSDYRLNAIGEFQGEIALICTCFGVSEETILEVIERTNAGDVGQVSAACKAGSGCGSCRMLIQELIDLQTNKSGGEFML